MFFQAYQAEGSTNIPTNARLAAIMKDWVRSAPGILCEKYLIALTNTITTAAPNNRKAARMLNASWMNDDQRIGGFATCLEDSMLDIINIPPGAVLTCLLLEITRHFSSIVTL